MARFALAGVLAAGGCSTAAPTETTPASASRFGANDKAWIATTTAMDEQLLPLLDLVPQNSGSPGLQALALQVKAFTDAELNTLYTLYDQAGLPAVNPRKGTAMAGAVTPAQVTAIGKLTGPAFDTAAVKAIKAHLEQTQDLAKGEDEAGVEPQTHALALQVLRTRDLALSTAAAIKD
jgi:uncharacterized protein (DUF305 family)